LVSKSFQQEVGDGGILGVQDIHLDVEYRTQGEYSSHPLIGRSEFEVQPFKLIVTGVSAGVHQRADGLAFERPQDVARLVDVQHDDGQSMLLAEGEGGLV